MKEYVNDLAYTVICFKNICSQHNTFGSLGVFLVWFGFGLFVWFGLGFLGFVLFFISHGHVSMVWTTRFF